MKNLVIIGASSLGKVTYEYALKCSEYKVEWDIKGYIDFDLNSQNDENYPSVIGTISSYQPEINDVFICSYANPKQREESVKLISFKGGEFINIIHPFANICKTSFLGIGNIIGAFTTISINVSLGNHIIIQDHCNIGHDSLIGDYSHLFVGNIVSGKNKIGNNIIIYTGSLIYPNIKIEDSSIVGAGSIVMRNVKEGTTVIGNPAKKME